MLITYPLLTVTDDAGVIVTGATVTISSVTDRAGTTIATPGATLYTAGSNIAVEYDADVHGEAWITLAISKAGSTITGLNAAPAFFLSLDPSRIDSYLGGGSKVAATVATGDGADTATILARIPGTIQPQTGDAYARIGAAGAGLTAIGDTRLAHLDADVTSRSTYAGGAVASVTAPVAVTGTVTANVTQVNGTAVTGTSIVDANVIQVNGASITGSALSADSSGRVRLAADALDVIEPETGYNARQLLSLIAAATFGNGTGFDTSTPAYGAVGAPATTRITATVSSSSRTVTLNPPT